MKSLYIYQAGNRHIQSSVTVHEDGTMTVDYTDSTPAADYLARKNADRPAGAPEFKLITWDELAPILKAFDDELLTPWQEITDQLWDDALNVLPPEKWETVDGVNIFRMMEYYTGNITAHYARTGGRYFTTLRRTSTPYAEIAAEVRAKAAATDALKAELAAAI